MWFVMHRVTIPAFVMLLLLLQVTPGLSCTFTKFNGARLTNVTAAGRYSDSNTTVEGCFKQCFKAPDCSSFIFDRKEYGCTVFMPGTREIELSLYGKPEVYKFDRNAFDTSCPRVEQWMAQHTNVAV